mgnify:FL=1
MNKQKVILTTIILIFVAANAFLGFGYFLGQKQLRIAEQQLKVQQNNTKIVNFTKLFIEKVLKAEKEVSFEERLILENAVRDLSDNDVLTQWEKFTDSKTETDAQEEVKNLLDLLVKKFFIN